MHGRASVPVQAMGTPCFEQQEGCCSECCVQLQPCCWNALKEDDRILMEDVEWMLCDNSFHCFKTHSCQLMMFLKILALDCSRSGQRLVGMALSLSLAKLSQSKQNACVDKFTLRATAYVLISYRFVCMLVAREIDLDRWDHCPDPDSVNRFLTV